MKLTTNSTSTDENEQKQAEEIYAFEKMVTELKDQSQLVRQLKAQRANPELIRDEVARLCVMRRSVARHTIRSSHPPEGPLWQKAGAEAARQMVMQQKAKEDEGEEEVQVKKMVMFGRYLGRDGPPQNLVGGWRWVRTGETRQRPRPL